MVVPVPVSNPVNVPFALSLVLGGFSGCIGATTVYPLDLIKTRLQNQRSTGGQRMYTGIVDCFAKTLRTEGVVGLYRGWPAQMVGIMPEKALKLSINDWARRTLLTRHAVGERLTFVEEMVAGAAAGFSQVIATNPYEIVKIQVQVQGVLPPEQRKTAMTIVRTLGLSGLFKGIGACLLRDVPFSMLYFSSYPELKYRFSSSDGTLSYPRQFAAGTIAGIFASGSVTPADVIKTRLQATPAPGEVPYAGIVDCGRRIVKQEGPAALFKGVLPRVLIVSPLFGITMFVFDNLMKFTSGRLGH